MLEARNDGLKHGNNGKGGKIAAGGGLNEIVTATK